MASFEPRWSAPLNCETVENMILKLESNNPSDYLSCTDIIHFNHPEFLWICSWRHQSFRRCRRPRGYLRCFRCSTSQGRTLLRQVSFAGGPFAKQWNTGRFLLSSASVFGWFRIFDDRRLNGCYECFDLDNCQKGYYERPNEYIAKASTLFIKKHGEGCYTSALKAAMENGINYPETFDSSGSVENALAILEKFCRPKP